MISDILIGIKKHMKDLVGELDSKSKQTNQSLDSVHVKSNSLDTQMKNFITKQDTMSEAIGKISDIVSVLHEKVEVMEKQDNEDTNNDTELVHHFNRNKSVHKSALIPDDEISILSRSEKSVDREVRNESGSENIQINTTNNMKNNINEKGGATIT